MSGGEQTKTARADAAERAIRPIARSPGLVLVFSRYGAQTPGVVDCSGAPVALGRDPSCSVPLAQAEVSRRHAELTYRSGALLIRDLGSTNGTLVNAFRIDGEVELSQDDIVRVGDNVFRVELESVQRFRAYHPHAGIVNAKRPFRHDALGQELVGGFAVDALLDMVCKLAPSTLSVTILGESGTGKELIAREIHRRSGRVGEFHAVNCAALSEQLIESELFGYRKGAFTGANADKLGHISAAHRGTLFLDEIGDMPLNAQAKLLRVLQEREVVPLGGTTAISVDVRVLCATHRDLAALVADGRFRGDLHARLREAEITAPPLRRRREDLVPLLRRFVGDRADDFDVDVIQTLATYPWPYNVRELQSAARYAVTMAPSGAVGPEVLPSSIQVHRPAESQQREHEGTRPRDVPSREELVATLVRLNGNVAAVARHYGKERMQIHRWAKQHGIDLDAFRT